ncbi:MAG: HAD family hydrolase [Bacteroidales bacterium]|nr:HAD family hydrolase [Candidatus Liminaster caballi]
MAYRTIIWDMDGTLMDTLQDLMLSVNYALDLNGMPQRTFAQIRSAVGNGVRRLVELSVPSGTDNPLFEKVFADFKAYYIEHCQDNTGLYEGIAETLRQLKQRGIRMAVVSNKLQSGVDELFVSSLHTVGHSDSVCLSDLIEVAIGERPEMARKPSPDMVEKAFEELGIDKCDAVYIGDSEVDLATARNSGLPCISVLWGFRDREFLLTQGATTFVEHPSEILNYI